MPHGPVRPTPGSAADRVDDADPADVARAICLKQLTAAPRTRAQLESALARRGVPDTAATEVLDRLTEVGLVDDAAFADSWVESRHRGRGLGRRALAHELRLRGVGGEAVTEALERLDPEQELATARALVARRLPAVRGLAREAAARRLVGMLARKGYGPAIVSRVVNDALARDLVPGDEPDPTTDGPQPD